MKEKREGGMEGEEGGRGGRKGRREGLTIYLPLPSSFPPSHFHSFHLAHFFHVSI